MRVYVPATAPLLTTMLEVGEVPPGTVFAVTPALREWYAEGDDEELEYAALTEAARASLRLLDLDPTAPRRRVVLAVEVPDAAVAPGDPAERAAVVLATAVPFSAVASGHLDHAEAEADVRRAAALVLEADLGSGSALEAVEDVEGHELLWFGTQELDAWVQLLG